jgi:HK97 family phage major capsid protein
MTTMMTTNQKLIQLSAEKTDILHRAQVALDSGGAKSPEYKSLIGRAQIVQEDLDLLNLIERKMPLPPAPIATPAPIAVPAIISDTSESRNAKINSAARTFFGKGVAGLNREERALLTTGDTTGGALISQSFDSVFVEAAKYFGPVWNLVNRKDAANAEPTKFVVSDDTERTFSLLTEGTTSAYSVKQTPTLFSDIDGTDTLVSSVVYSVQELDDAFDLESFLTRNAGVAVSRAWETAITLGLDNGTSSALPNSPSGGLLGGISAGVTQAGGTLAAGVTTANLQALAGSVDRAYYQNGSFMASPSVETFLRSQVSTTGKQLYKIDPNTGYLIIAGRPLVPNAAMAENGTASSPLVLFGDYSKAYNVLNAGGLKIMVISESQVTNIFAKEMIMYTRIGASAGLSTSVKSLVSAAD